MITAVHLVLGITGLLIVVLAIVRFGILEMIIFIPVGISLMLLAAKCYKTALMILVGVGSLVGYIFYSLNQPFILPAPGHYTGTVVTVEPVTEASNATVVGFRINNAPINLDRNLQSFIEHDVPFILVQDDEGKINDGGDNYIPYQDQKLSTGSVLKIQGELRSGNLILSPVGNSTSAGLKSSFQMLMRVQTIKVLSAKSSATAPWTARRYPGGGGVMVEQSS